jgi:ABC-type nitrate/sulfonate/bicarbonate transport system ATPase subunit
MTSSRAALSIVPEPADRPVKLSVRGARKSFTTGSGTRIAALEDVSFDVATGEFVCLIGPSGCGVSMILSLLAGSSCPTRGRS